MWNLCRRKVGIRGFEDPEKQNFRVYAGIKLRFVQICPNSEEQSYLSCRITIVGKLCFSRNLYLQQPRKKGPMPLHFQDKFPTFAGDILNYGSVTLFSCGERRKFKHNRENKWHCPPVVSSRYRRGVVAYFIYWVSYDLSH